MRKNDIELYCGKFSEIDITEAGSVLSISHKTGRVSSNWRAAGYFAIFGLLLNLFGLYSYYTLGEEYKISNADDLLIGNYFATIVCALAVFLLFKLWKTTKRSHWETKICKENGRLESVSAHEWVGIDCNDWAVRRLIIPGNPIGGVTTDTDILLAQSNDGNVVIPVLSSVSSQFEQIYRTVVEISGQPELKTLKLKSKISATGNVRIRVDPNGKLTADAVG